MFAYCTGKNFEKRQDYFVCSTSRKKGTDVCDTHYIRAVVLEEGVLTESRFKMLAEQYEQEQRELKEKVKTVSDEIEQQEQESNNVERFIAKVHKYFDLQELTPDVLNDLVKRVEVYAPDKIDGRRTQFIDIYYDFIGLLPMSLLQSKMNNSIA